MFELIVQNEIVGEIVFGVAPDGFGVINLIEVKPNCRGKGFGNQLLNEAIAQLKCQGVKGIRLTPIKTKNPFIVDWYRKKGFVLNRDRMLLTF